MPRLFNRPRNMPRLFQGRMFNRLTGQRAPRLYSGRRPQRASNRFFGTQVSPYGAGGGGRHQAMTAHAGHGGNVYAAMLNQSRRGGTNLGMRTVTLGYRGTRMHRGFRQQQADIKRDYRDKIREQKRIIRNAGGGRTNTKLNTARAELARLRGQHRVDRRSAAASWSKRHGGISPRIGINVGQTGGRRYIRGFNFRRQRGGHSNQLARAESRNMRIANRMGPPARGTLKFDARLHGGQRDTGPVYRYPATHAKFRYDNILHGGRGLPRGPYRHHRVGTVSWDGIIDPRHIGNHPEQLSRMAHDYLRGGGRVFGRQMSYREYKNRQGHMFSDHRLKTDIKPMRTSPSGITIYQFRYAEDGPLYQGVIAQELLETHPNAVVTMPNGYYGVRYDLIDVDFVKVSEKELALHA